MNYLVDIRPTLHVLVPGVANVSDAKALIRAFLADMQVQKDFVGVDFTDDDFGTVTLLDDQNHPVAVPGEEEIRLREQEVANFEAMVANEGGSTWTWVLEMAKQRLQEAKDLRALAGLES
jgi:hypothetical protein